MTNGYTDIKNTDMMLIMGGNPAENHPCGFKWAVEAKVHRNAKTIVVDPRLTRTAANADMYLQIRAGADIAFLGGLINYALSNNRIAKDYLVNYTNASFIIKEGFQLPDDGLFSGFDAEHKTYDKATWNYEEGGNLEGNSAAAAGSATAALHSTANPSAQQQQPKENTGDAHKLEGLGYAAQGPAGAKASNASPIPPPQLPPKIAYDLSLQHP